MTRWLPKGRFLQAFVWLTVTSTVPVKVHCASSEHVWSGCCHLLFLLSLHSSVITTCQSILTLLLETSYHTISQTRIVVTFGCNWHCYFEAHQKLFMCFQKVLFLCNHICGCVMSSATSSLIWRQGTGINVFIVIVVWIKKWSVLGKDAEWNN